MAKATRDLDEIYNCIVQEFKEIETAEQMANLLESAILGLDEMPYRGAVRRVGDSLICKAYRLRTRKVRKHRKYSLGDRLVVQ
jgi:plasmid stabilization system protein ParE